MNILAISHEFPPIGGGGANACYFLSKGFVERGHKVTLVTACFDGLKDREEINGVDVIRVDAKRSRLEQCSFVEMLSFLAKAYPVANRLCKDNKYDVCLIFFGIPAGPIGYILKKKYKLPYVIRFGGGDIPGFQERFTNVYKMIGPAIKLIWEKADKRIANSEGLRELAYNFCDKYPFDIVCNGVDTNVFVPANKEQHSEVRLLFVSRLIERKGLQYVLPQLKDIDNISLTIVGDGPYRQTLEDRVKSNSLTEKVVFVGQKDKSEIVPYYQNADIFILPSSKEGMPNVVLEAMSCGLPIIMTPCQGSAELVDDSNGYVVPKDEFKGVIQQISRDDTLRYQLSDGSRKKAINDFSWDSVVEKYIDILENVSV